MIVQHFDDGTANPEWLSARAGCFTASRASDLMARTKSGPAASRDNLIAQLVVERLTGKPAESGFQTDAMRRGIELEPRARVKYEARVKCLVEETGFLLHPTVDRVGCSPDGLVNDDGLLEIKCLNAARHIAALEVGQHAKDYRWQLQHQMWVTQRAWVDCVAFHPDFPDNLQLAVVRVERDKNLIAELFEAVAIADREINERVERLMSLRAA